MPSTIAVRPRPGIPLRHPAPNLVTLSVDALVFLLAVLCSFEVTLIGQLPYTEIVLLFLLPVVLATRAKAIFRKEYRTVYLLMGLWLFSQIVTDAYRGMPFDNRMKGTARVVFFAIDLAVLSAIIGTNLRRIKLFFLGEAVSGILSALLYPADRATGVLWKMTLSAPVAIIFLLIGSHYYTKGKTSVPVALLFVLAALNLRFGVRSGVLICIAAAVLYLPIFVPPKPGQPPPRLGRPAKLAILVAMGVFVTWFSQEAIHWAVQTGLYSQNETNKFEVQSGGKLGALFGGRPEGPVAIRAIMDSPILGHGSYASDPKYNIMLQDYQYQWGYTDTDAAPDPDEPEGIPTHSHLTMAWVEGGVLASFFWFYMLALICRSVLRLTEIRHPLAPIYGLVFISLFWDILFSPFGNTRRVSEAFAIILMVSLMKKPVPRRTGWRVGRGQAVPRQQTVWRKPLRPGVRPVPGTGRALHPPLPRRAPV